MKVYIQNNYDYGDKRNNQIMFQKANFAKKALLAVTTGLTVAGGTCADNREPYIFLKDTNTGMQYSLQQAMKLNKKDVITADFQELKNNVKSTTVQKQYISEAKSTKNKKTDKTGAWEIGGLLGGLLLTFGVGSLCARPAITGAYKKIFKIVNKLK